VNAETTIRKMCFAVKELNSIMLWSTRKLNKVDTCLLNYRYCPRETKECNSKGPMLYPLLNQD
jgi:hypothetical protein